nr:MAG TPA: hypothetical protein [Caudoviricetes sp.]
MQGYISLNNERRREIYVSLFCSATKEGDSNAVNRMFEA